MAKPLRLGTRRSTLAWAQSLWVAERLQAALNGRSVELVPIETRGDRITDVPLRELEGKEFFTAEIDQALLSGAVDITVHSLKDLSLERPAGIALGAIPPRENPRDVIVFRRGARAHLGRGEHLRIGTSAPRRVENVPHFLERALPGARGRIECIEIRGNVDTRLGRLHESDDSARKLDGVVLALAGLVRLWRDTRGDGGREKLTRLLRETRWMVLPITDCPSAPGQGALAVECRSDDETVRALLASLDDAATAQLVGEERRVLARLGGGCHQKFGATCVEHPSCGPLLYIKGVGSDGERLDRVEWLAMPAAPVGRVAPWDGFRARESSDVPPGKVSAEVHAALRRSSLPPVFVAHSRAMPPGIESDLDERRVWTSGTASWYRLAERGVWVEGCAEGLGYDWIASTLAEPVLGLPPLTGWQVLSHTGSADYWPAGEVIGTYRLPDVASQAIPHPHAVTHAYWASGSQFRELWSQLPPTVHHACGPGKTADAIRAAGVHRLTVFPAVHEWRRWLKIDPHTTG